MSPPHHDAPAGALRVDLNADLGELDALWQDGTEEALLRLVTSASVACGGHAGDAVSMRRTVERAHQLGVAVGAHPSYPDRAGFGRERVEMPRAALAESLAAQIAALATIAGELGVPLLHVKPHGALYHAAAFDPVTADAVADAVERSAPRARLVGLAGSPGLARWRALGHLIAAEGFADRRYECDGTLRSRALAGALVADPAQAAEQALRLARRGDVDTVCVHSDTPHAVAIATAVRQALLAPG